MTELFQAFLLTLDATLRVATPLIFAALAGLFAERSGIVDIGLEGKMLAAAFIAASVSAVTGSAWLGLLGGVSVSVGLGLLHGVACIRYHGDHIVSGMAINMIIAGLTMTLGVSWFALGGQTPGLEGDARFVPLYIPGTEMIAEWPVLGAVFSELISGHNLLVYVALLSVPLCYFVLFRTRFGLRLRAVGENPAAVETAGISVPGLRYSALVWGGVLCGLAGVYLSLAHNAGFLKDMSAGKGYIALAALIFGKWRPFPVLMACLLFGFLESFAIRLQGSSLPVIGAVPVQLIEVIPYVLTVCLLAGLIGQARPPKAIGLPYRKEQ